jgi:hypothetical protein
MHHIIIKYKYLFKMNNYNQHDAFKQSIKNIDNFKAKNIVQYYISETIKLSFITGPLYCLSANLQYLDKSLFESISDKNTRKLPAYSITRPFRPNFYYNYRDCIYNLYKQGIGGFFKGNLLRLFYFGSTSELKLRLENTFGKYIKSTKVIREIIFYSIADIILHPLLFVESRYCIQNRRKGYRLYNNLFTVIRMSWRELYNGSIYSIPRNFIFVTSLNLYYLFPSTYMNIFTVSLAHIASYPLLTVQRNIIFHSKYIDYLPFPENISFKNFLNKYGFFGLYRGFLAYSFATGLWHVYVPMAAKKKLFDYMFQNESNAFKLNIFDDDEDYEVNN